MVTTRLTLAALALLSAAVAAHNFSPRTSAELVAMLEELRSGDQISLQEMTYLLPAPLTLSNLHSIKIKGKGDGKTILDGAGKTRIMELNEVQDIAITGIVFKHGNADASSLMGGSGGAVRISKSTAVTFDACDLNDNIAEGSGGAIYAQDSSQLTVSRSTFAANRANALGGAFSTLNVDDCTVSASTFTGNKANVAGAVAGKGGTHFLLHDNSFHANVAATIAPAAGFTEVLDLHVSIANSFVANTCASHADMLDSVALSVAGGTTVYEDSKGESALRARCAPDGSFSAAPASGGWLHSLMGSPEPVETTFQHIAVAHGKEGGDVFVRLTPAGGAAARTKAAPGSDAVVAFGAEALQVSVDPADPHVLIELFEDKSKPVLVGSATVDLSADKSGGTYALETKGRGKTQRGKRGSQPDAEADATPTVSLEWASSKPIAKSAKAAAPAHAARPRGDHLAAVAHMLGAEEDVARTRQPGGGLVAFAAGALVGAVAAIAGVAVAGSAATRALLGSAPAPMV